jgi:hypothetical protein
MKILNWSLHAAICVVLSLFSFSAGSADYPAPKEADWIAQDFAFTPAKSWPSYGCTTQRSAGHPASLC